MTTSTGSTHRTSTSAKAPRRASIALRERLVDAALVEFAANGFEGASTRAIAARARAHQPQINYHFESKDALWRAVLERLIAELDDTIGIADLPADPRAAFVSVIRGLVRFAAARPELHRIMIHEATAPSSRLDWLVETHLRRRYELLGEAWNELRAADETAPIPAHLVYHLLVGAAALLHANAPEARLLVGIEPSAPEVVEAHADALVHMFLDRHGGG